MIDVHPLTPDQAARLAAGATLLLVPMDMGKHAAADPHPIADDLQILSPATIFACRCDQCKAMDNEFGFTVFPPYHPSDILEADGGRQKVIAQVRQRIEQQEDDAPEEARGSFDTLLCYYMHKQPRGDGYGGLTFMELSVRWDVPLPLLGTLIADHCNRLVGTRYAVKAVRCERVAELADDDLRALGVVPDMVDSGGQDQASRWVEVPDYLSPFAHYWTAAHPAIPFDEAHAWAVEVVKT